MKISTEIDSISRITSDEKAIELVAKAGFDAWDFSMFQTEFLVQKDYLAYATRLRQIGLDNGIVCNQSHAPFPSSMQSIRALLPRAIECTAQVGAEICVIHPDQYKSIDENAEMFLELLPLAKQCGIKIAVENIYVRNAETTMIEACTGSLPQSLLKLVNAIDDDHFVACMDVGHAEFKCLGTSAVDIVKTLGPKLQALHIHDTDRINDSHQIPFSMDINFENIVKALKEANYKGYFTLEAPCYLLGCSQDNIFEKVKDLAAAAKKLACMYEAY